MPVRSLNSPVLKWLNSEEIDKAVRSWAEKIARRKKEICAIDYFGSYARGDWGVGIGVDLIIIVANSDKPFVRRAVEFDSADL